MLNALGIINVIENEQILGALSENRPYAAVPIDGRYRIIDYPLSNMVNAGIKSVGIFTHYKMGSLIAHLKNGREWNLDTKRRGLFFLSPDFSKYIFSPNKWDISHFTSRLGYIQSSTRKYALISGCNMICNIDFQKVRDFHEERGADITIVCKEIAPEEKEKFDPCLLLDITEDRRVHQIKNVNGPASGHEHICLEMFLLSRKLLLDIIEECTKQNKWDLIQDGMIRNSRNLKVVAYPFSGYLAKINSISNYFDHHMDLLNLRVWQELFYQSGPIITKTKDSAPTKYTGKASVHNSLVSNDCIIAGEIENSVIFRGAKAEQGSVIKNSLVLQKCIIEEGAQLEYAILDKGVHISKGKIIKGTKEHPAVIKKNDRI